MMRYLTTLIIFLSFTVSAYTQTLHLYGGRNNDEYLGCLNCSDLDSNSIWNDLGSYGNYLNPDSIWNDLGTYGNDLSNYSPWNDFASYPPVVVDSDGTFYGYLTVNDLKTNRAEFSLALALYRYHDDIMDDVSGWYQRIFE